MQQVIFSNYAKSLANHGLGNDGLVMEHLPLVHEVGGLRDFNRSTQLKEQVQDFSFDNLTSYLA